METGNTMINNNLALGIDIGGTSCKCGIIDGNCNIIYQTKIKSDLSAKPSQVLAGIADIVSASIEKYPQVKSIGMGVPGVVSNGRIINSPNFTALLDIDFTTYFKSNFKLPFAMDNDANAAAIAEMLHGYGKNYDNFIYITLGTGVGGAIIINRQIFHGQFGGAGEIGHTIIDIQQNEKYLPSFRNGTLEEKVGRAAIIKYARNNISAKSALFNTDFDVCDIAQYADKADTEAVAILNQIGMFLGCGIATIANILDIPNFIIGGGIANSSILINNATNTAINRSIPCVANNINIKQAKFIDNTGIIGAALLPSNIN